MDSLYSRGYLIDYSKVVDEMAHLRWIKNIPRWVWSWSGPGLVLVKIIGRGRPRWTGTSVVDEDVRSDGDVRGRDEDALGLP